MAKFDSACKVGGTNKVPFYNDKGSVADLNEIPENYFTVENFKSLRKQLVTDPHPVERTLTGTQVIKGALSNLLHWVEYQNIKLGSKLKVTGNDIADAIMRSLSSLSEEGKDRLYDEFGIVENEDGTLTLDEEVLGSKLEEETINSNLSTKVVNAFKRKDGKFIKSLKGLSVTKWIEQGFVSITNKRTVDVNLPGNSFIQMSSFGFETLDTNEKIRSNTDDNLNQYISDEGVTLNNGEPLKFMPEDNSTECMISMTLFNPILPKHLESYRQKRKWLFDNNFLGPNARPMAMGYRIPTQGQSSIDVLHVMDVLPENIGDTIILPAAFTKKNGSDKLKRSKSE